MRKRRISKAAQDVKIADLVMIKTVYAGQVGAVRLHPLFDSQTDSRSANW